MAGVDDIIKQWVEQVEKSGELKNSPQFGKPFDFNDGYSETPEELRAAYKILKNAGYVPAEVELFRQLAALKDQLAAADDEEECNRLRTKLAEMQQKVTMMLDRLRGRR
jgi:DNA-binding transcriptional ArsR family regulator